MKIRRIKSISEFHRIRGLSSPIHPLLSLIDYGKTKILPEYIGEHWTFDFYSIGIKRNVGTLRYGQQEYDFNEGILSFISPGQRLSIEPNNKKNLKPSGWLLLIHPNFFWNTTLANSIKEYDFFDYDINEALFMSKKEENLVENGLPSVKFIADQLNLSPSYLSNLLKSLTGLSAQQHIHEKLIALAKEKLSTTELTVSEIAYGLGFGHPQSFSKLFKKKVKLSPMKFRTSFN